MQKSAVCSALWTFTSWKFGVTTTKINLKTMTRPQRLPPALVLWLSHPKGDPCLCFYLHKVSYKYIFFLLTSLKIIFLRFFFFQKAWLWIIHFLYCIAFQYVIASQLSILPLMAYKKIPIFDEHKWYFYGYYNTWFLLKKYLSILDEFGLRSGNLCQRNTCLVE